jgi:hypothetical protein
MKVYYLSIFDTKNIFSGHFLTKHYFFHTTVNPGSGTGIPVMRSSSTVIPVLKNSAGIVNPTKKAQVLIKGAFEKVHLEIFSKLALKRIWDRGPVWVLRTHEKKTKRELFHFFEILTATRERLARKKVCRTHQNRAIDLF